MGAAWALWAPDRASANPSGILRRMQSDAIAFGIGEEADIADILRQLDDGPLHLAAGLLDTCQHGIDIRLRVQIDHHAVGGRLGRGAVDDTAAGGRLGVLKNPDRLIAYILAPQRLAPGDAVVSGEKVDVKPGNAMPLAAMPVGTIVHNVEMKPGKGGQIARSAGTYAQYLGRDAGYALLRLNSFIA